MLETGAVVHNYDPYHAPMLKSSSTAKLQDPEYVAELSVRLSIRALRAGLSNGRTGSEAERAAEVAFEGFKNKLNRLLAGASSDYRLFTQQAAVRSGRTAGNRVSAWNSYTQKWRYNTKRLDRIISDITSKPNKEGFYEAIYGADFTVTVGGGSKVRREYANAFPQTKLFGIDPSHLKGFGKK